MPERVQAGLVVVGLLIVVGMLGVHSYLLLRLMGEVEKFGRLLLKVRRRAKAEDERRRAGFER